MKEIWKDVVGYEKSYTVSNTGTVKSKNREIVDCNGRVLVRKGVTLSPTKNHCGYLMVGLSNNSETVLISIHRLVATAFIENIDNKPQVNHIDEDKLNNRTTNLEWVTAFENCHHGNLIERRAKAQYKSVIRFDLDGNMIDKKESLKAYGEMGFDCSSIAKVCKGIHTHHKGFVFRYGDKGEIKGIEVAE